MNRFLLAWIFLAGIGAIREAIKNDGEASWVLSLYLFIGVFSILSLRTKDKT